MVAATTLFAILNGVSQLAGNAIAMNSAKEKERSLMAQKSELDSEYAEGVLEDEGSKAYMRALDRKTRDNIQGIENSVVSTGSTSENRLAQMDRANEVVSNAVGNLLQREEDKKTSLFKMRRGVAGELADEKMRQANNWVDIANNVSKAASALGESYMDELIDDGVGAVDSEGKADNGYVIPNKVSTKPLEEPAKKSMNNINPIMSESDQYIFRQKNIESANNQMAGKIMAGDGSQYDDESRLGDNR